MIVYRTYREKDTWIHKMFDKYMDRRDKGGSECRGVVQDIRCDIIYYFIF